jgi:hypothetical protein
VRQWSFNAWWLALALCSACAADAKSPTQLVVEVDSDLSVPAELDSVTVEVKQARAPAASADLAREAFPRTLGMVHSGGPMGPFLLHATGYLKGEVVVESSLSTTFEDGKTVQVSMFLERACSGISCAEGETCRDGACVSVESEPADAGASVDRGEAGTADAGADRSLTDAGGAPRCTIQQPASGDTLLTRTSFNARGGCVAEDGSPISQGLSWRSDRDGPLGSGGNANLTLQSTGPHVLSLCAANRADPTQVGCDMVTINAVATPAPTAMITVSEQGATTHSPFRNTSPIVFSGVGSGSDVTLSWSDSLQGRLGSTSTVNLNLPVVGKHTVSLTVTDRFAQTASASVIFTVLASGQAALVESFASANPILAPARALLERAPGAIYAAGSDGKLYGLDVQNLASSAQLALDRPPLPGDVRDQWLDTNDGLLYLATSNGLSVCSYSASAGVASCSNYKGGQLPSDNVLSVARVAANAGSDRLLIGTNAGLLVADNVEGSNAGVLRANERAIRAIASDRSTAWLATDQGLYRYPLMTGAAMRVGSGNNSASWTSIALASDGSVWLGGSAGVSRYAPGPDAWSSWRTAEGLSSNQVSSLTLEVQTIDGSAHDVFWIGTNAGVSRFDVQANTFQSLTTADGLPSNAVLDVLVMSDGSKLFATDAGVARYGGR